MRGIYLDTARFVFLCLFFLIPLLPVHAYYFRSYQVEDGLSHNSVWAVMQDDKGFIWFGTNDGLNRFDGKTFKIYRREPSDSLSIGNNFIHCLKEDAKGRFFIGTKQGLYQFDFVNETFTHVNLTSNGVVEASINSIMEDPEGNIWLACHGQGVYVLNPDLSIKKHYLHTDASGSLPSDYIWAIEKDYYGNIWLGSIGKGVILFDTKKEIFTSLSTKKELGITAPVIYSLYCDIDNNIWIGTSGNGLIRYNYKADKVNHYMDKEIFNIKSIIEYSDHELIMGCDKGLVKFDRLQETFNLINNNSPFDNLTDNSIFSIAKDNEGSFWIGTYFGGVNYYSPAINRFGYCFNTPSNSLKKNIVSSFAEGQDGKIWIGTHNDGLYLFDPVNLRFTQPYDIHYRDVQNLLADKKHLYISLYGKGMNILNLVDGSLHPVRDKLPDKFYIGDNSTISFYRTSKGNILFMSERGVDCMEFPEEIKGLERLSDISVKCITEDYKGALWFATHLHGLLRLSADGRWDSFVHDPDDPASLVDNNINCVFQDSHYRIWAGTEGEGLTLFNPQSNCFELVLNDKSGLPSNIIYSILDDADGNVWVTTGGGLVRISADLKSVKSFDYLSDIQQIRYNLNCALRASDNRLYFGGTNGFILFNPKEIMDNPNKPPVQITSFRIFNKEILPREKESPLCTSISTTKEIVLNHNQSSFSFGFVALSYLSPAQNRYAYMLEGFDKEWNYVKDNSAAYTNIPAGKYTFKVKGTNNDGIWSESVADIRLIITPSPWLSGKMIMLYFVLFCGTSIFLVRRYHQYIALRNQEKIYKYQTAKEKEMYESKINFFTHIAHEIRTPLSLIVAPLEKIILSDDGNLQTKNNLAIIERNVNRLLELINQLLDFRKIEEDRFQFNFRKYNVVKIAQDVYNQYYQHACFNNIEMVLSSREDTIESVVDVEAIYKIVSNLVANAIKYATSKIEIEVEKEEIRWKVSVKDDGSGIDAVYQDKIFEPFFRVQDKDHVVRTGSGLGLSLSQSLALKHNGRITVESESGQGCLFTLSVPLIINSEYLHEEGFITFGKERIKDEQAIEVTINIVIVEDNNELRAFLRESLQENYRIFEAENGIRALEIIEKENIDIIISDILMPEMDGLELCNTLKSNPAYSHLPLILLSAKTDTSTKIDGLKKGAEAYLEKPFSMEQLKAQITSIIENRNNIRNNFIKSPLLYFKQGGENNENAQFIKKLNTVILENMSDESFSIDNLSGLFAVSRSNFHKKIKNITGLTPNDYIKLIRLNESARLLSTNKYKINEVCYLVGFNTPSYFSKCFYEHFGKLPKEFIQEIPPNK